MPRRIGVPTISAKMVEEAEPHTILAKGTATDSADELHIADTGNMVRWVAVRGGIADWAIYVQNPHYGRLVWDYDRVKSYGDKIHSSTNIQMLVELGDDHVLSMYRH